MTALSGSITVLAEGDPSTEPALKKVYDDFKARNPAVEWDIRAIPGLGPDWHRLARAAMASGEPVGLLMMDGLFVRAWARDGLRADLVADPGLSNVLARVPKPLRLASRRSQRNCVHRVAATTIDRERSQSAALMPSSRYRGA
jgi:ABC-type glycerol-3-phosphate transport system substrate-binding protein